MDLPAKASVLNVKQFNGEFGCIACDHPGEGSKKARKWIYPYTTKVSSYKLTFSKQFYYLLNEHFILV